MLGILIVITPLTGYPYALRSFLKHRNVGNHIILLSLFSCGGDALNSFLDGMCKIQSFTWHMREKDFHAAQRRYIESLGLHGVCLTKLNPTSFYEACLVRCMLDQVFFFAGP